MSYEFWPGTGLKDGTKNVVRNSQPKANGMEIVEEKSSFEKSSHQRKIQRTGGNSGVRFSDLDHGGRRISSGERSNEGTAERRHLYTGNEGKHTRENSMDEKLYGRRNSRESSKVDGINTRSKRAINQDNDETDKGRFVFVYCSKGEKSACPEGNNCVQVEKSRTGGFAHDPNGLQPQAIVRQRYFECIKPINASSEIQWFEHPDIALCIPPSRRELYHSMVRQEMVYSDMCGQRFEIAETRQAKSKCEEEEEENECDNDPEEVAKAIAEAKRKEHQAKMDRMKTFSKYPQAGGHVHRQFYQGEQSVSKYIRGDKTPQNNHFHRKAQQELERCVE